MHIPYCFIKSFVTTDFKIADSSRIDHMTRLYFHTGSNCSPAIQCCCGGVGLRESSYAMRNKEIYGQSTMGKGKVLCLCTRLTILGGSFVNIRQVVYQKESPCVHTLSEKVTEQSFLRMYTSSVLRHPFVYLLETT